MLRAKPKHGCSARNDNNPHNFNDNNGFRVVVSTLLWTGLSLPEMPGGYAFRAEARNGGVLSWPRSWLLPGAG